MARTKTTARKSTTGVLRPRLFTGAAQRRKWKRLSYLKNFNVNQTIRFSNKPKQKILSKSEFFSEIKNLFKISKSPKTAKNFENQLNEKLALIFTYFQHELKQVLSTLSTDPSDNQKIISNNVISEFILTKVFCEMLDMQN
jgi:hypothetical protein